MTGIYEITPNEVNELLKQDKAILIDVREISENESESIPNAINMPLSSVPMELANLPDLKDKKLIIHCRSGKRSMMACTQLIQNGAEIEIGNLAGGILAWESAGLPLKKKKALRPYHSPENQQQIALGIVALIAAGISYINVTVSVILMVILGLGMLRNGISGYCYLTYLLKKMPWNR